jgi:hypothetical protein
LAAQGGSGKDGYADEHHRNDCRLAHQVLVLGQPANQRSWALATAPTCGASGGEALAAALWSHRGDAAPGSDLEALVRASAGITDGSVFEAGVRLGVDAGAGTAARAAGWRVALFQLVPGTYTEWVDEDGGALAGPLLTAAPFRGAPLPANRLSTTRQAVDGALASGATALELRDVMERVLAAVELEEQIERVCGPASSLLDSACRQAVDTDDADQ